MTLRAPRDPSKRKLSIFATTGFGSLAFLVTTVGAPRTSWAQSPGPHECASYVGTLTIMTPCMRDALGPPTRVLPTRAQGGPIARPRGATHRAAFIAFGMFSGFMLGGSIG